MKTGPLWICSLLCLSVLNASAPAAASETPGVSSAPAAGVRLYRAGQEELAYSKPAFWGAIAKGPKDFGTFIQNSFSKEGLPWLAAITASTLVLIEYDEKINSNTRRLGRKLNIASKDKTKPFLKIGKIPILRGPADLGSAMYFLGDGWVSLGLCAYFETYGWLKDDWRAAATGHQLVEGLLVTGFTTQVIKRATGRETPSAASAPRGVWRFFPSFAEFQGHRTRYDAFPSGHLATGMMAITVMSENYPEKKLIKPIGYLLLGALSFQMVNNGVHWASDYPLGLGIGYAVGKAITANSRARTAKTASALRFYPSIVPGGSLGLNLAYRF